MKILIIPVIIAAAVFTSCGSDDDSGTAMSTNVEAPATYVFERDGVSTVSFLSLIHI